MLANMYAERVAPYKESPPKSSAIVGSAVRSEVVSKATSDVLLTRPIANARRRCEVSVTGALS